MGWFDGAFLTPTTYSYLLLIKGKKKNTFSLLKREKWHTSIVYTYIAYSLISCWYVITFDAGH